MEMKKEIIVLVQDAKQVVVSMAFVVMGDLEIKEQHHAFF